MAKQQKKKEESTSLDLGLLDDGTVVMQFGRLVKQMTFTAAQARALGVGLIENATHSDSRLRVNSNLPVRKM